MDDQQLREVVELATLAPSVHNTQPWRFEVGSSRLDLYADPTRQLRVLDTSGRQLVISCGGVLEFARLAVRSFGHECTVELLPDSGGEEHLAALHVGAERPPSAEEQALVRAMPTRRTHRDPFEPRPLPPALVEDLRRGAAEASAWLHPLHESRDLAVLGALLDRAEAAEMADPAYRAELRRWRREGANDGIPASALPTEARAEHPTNLPIRDFDLAGATAPDPAGSVERPLVAVLGTDDDDRRAWLQGGQALGWVLLRAAAAGVQASPLGQVLDVPWTRSVLARELRLVGHPQMVLRMGYASGVPTTPRRPVSSVIR